MKKSIYRVFFIISLIPYVVLFFYALHTAVNGFRFTFISSQMIYGFNGFLHGLTAGICSPVGLSTVPICLTYQITYLVFRKKEHKKAVLIAPVAVGGFICLLMMGWNVYQNISEHNQAREQSRLEAEIRDSVREMVKNADEIIGYGRDSGGKIYGTKFTQSTMFIDYDSRKVAFLYFYGYKEYVLSESAGFDVCNVQYEAALKYPGKSITMFYQNGNVSETVAIELRMADGSIYAIDDMKNDYDYPGVDLNLPWTQQQDA